MTVVWPVLGFCTSMLVPMIAATLPDAGTRALAGAAAPAAEATVVATTRAVAPVPRHLAQRRRTVLPLVGVCIWMFLISVSLPLLVSIERGGYSLRSASIGANAAARLAG